MDRRDVKEIAISLIVGFGVMYAGFWFVSLEPNPTKWHWIVRLLFATWSLAASRIFYSYKYE